MDITNEALPWTGEDTDAFRIFLQTRTGSRLIPKILEHVPTLLSGGPVNEILIRSGEVRGFQKAAGAFLSLSSDAPIVAEPVSAYPPLEDDNAWTGEKLNPTNTP
jgi:hypothetical protein